MSQDPVRLEPYLTRDCVDGRAKMAGLSERRDPHVSQIELAALWILLALLTVTYPPPKPESLAVPGEIAQAEPERAEPPAVNFLSDCWFTC